MYCRANDSNLEGEAIVPVSAAFYEVEQSETLREFVFLLQPRFTFLAFASALDPLRIANQLSQKPLYRWSILSETGEAVTSSSGVSVNVDTALKAPPDHASIFVCSGLVSPDQAAPETLAVLRRHARFGGRVGGICTGAITLARAGLLQDRKATLHWENQPAFVESFPYIEITSNIFEIDGKIVTCGGGSAAMDMMLHFIKEDLGPQFSKLVADMCLTGTSRSREAQQRSSIGDLVGWRNPRLIEALRLMNENIDLPLPIEEIADSVGSSRRQLERLFVRYLKTSPRRYYRDLRLDHARGLLRETNMAVLDIAMASGFSNTTTFCKSFRQRFGRSPTEYKRA